MTNYYIAPTSQIITVSYPTPVGFWLLSDHPQAAMFAMYSKPTDEQIANTEKLLGWKWRDA